MTGVRTVRRSDGQTAQLALLPASPPARLTTLDHHRRGTEFRGLPVRTVLNPPASTGMSFWSLNPYVGCEFGCSYCYARDTHRWVMERWDGVTACPERSEGVPPTDSFERLILVKSDAASVLRRTLNPARVGNATILIGTATDPYQPAERMFGLTRQLLETLLAYRGLTVGITTKSSLVTRDIDLLVQLADRHDLHVSLSLATTDPVLLRQLEPRTPLPHARLRALAALTRAGIHAGVLLAPILPGLTDGWASLAAVMEAAKGAGARFVTGSALRLGPAARACFLPLLRREFPGIAARYERHYATSANASRAYTSALARRIRLLQEVYGFADGRTVGRSVAARID